MEVRIWFLLACPGIFSLSQLFGLISQIPPPPTHSLPPGEGGAAFYRIGNEDYKTSPDQGEGRRCP